MVENENENQVQEKDVVDKAVEAGVNKGKNFVAKKTKNWIVAHLPIILKAIGIFFLIILALGIINLIPFLIEQTFNKILGIFDPDDPNAEANANNMDRIVYINKDSGHGEYKLAVTDFAEQILEELENKKVDPEAAEFITEDLEDMIDKYIKAEVQTSYLKTEAFGNEVDGIITVSRLSADAGEGNQTPQKLGYMPYEQFEGKSNDVLLPFFSIDPDTFKLWLVVRDSNGNYAKKQFDYMTSIQGYSVPFRFFIILHVFAQDVDFMQDFVKLVLGSGNEAPIELTYVESKSVITTESTYEGGIVATVYPAVPEKGDSAEHIPLEGTDDVVPTFGELEGEYSNYINDDNITEIITSESTTPKIETIYSGKLYVTKADTWIKTSNKIVEPLKTEPRPSSSSTENLIGELSTIFGKNAVDENGRIVDVRINREYDIVKTTTTTITDSKYIVTDGESAIKLTEDEGIIKLINEYPKVKDNLTSAPSNLFYLLQQSENTQTLEKIMRYVLYVLSGTDYGITIEDLEYLLSEDRYNSISSSKLLKQYIRSWENRNPPIITVDGEECYLVEDDGYGHPTVGYGVDIENCGYTEEIKMAMITTEQGDAVPVEIVDNVEEKVIKDKAKYIKAVTSGLDLTSYQLNALISRGYNTGESGAVDVKRGDPALNFVDSYKTYWNQENDDKFDEKTTIPDDTHKLYTQYMYYPVYSNGEFSYGLENRRYSEWTLFQTGYYDKLACWDREVSAETILEVCAEVTDEMISYYDIHYEGTGRQNIELDSDFSKNKKIVCASYVAVILYRAGALEPETINKYNYNSCASLERMFEDAGWIRVSVEDAEPGDVGLWSEHTFIYAGDNYIWDQNCGAWSSDGTPPEGGPVAWWNDYKNKPGIHMWRMP